MRCPNCEYVFEDGDDCDCGVVDTRDYVAHPLTATELLQREYYGKLFLKPFLEFVEKRG